MYTVHTPELSLILLLASCIDVLHSTSMSWASFWEFLIPFLFLLKGSLHILDILQLDLFAMLPVHMLLDYLSRDLEIWNKKVICVLGVRSAYEDVPSLRPLTRFILTPLEGEVLPIPDQMEIFMRMKLHEETTYVNLILGHPYEHVWWHIIHQWKA